MQEWWPILGIMCGLLLMLATGMPVAFCFLFVTLIGLYFLWGGVVGLERLIFSIYDGLASFVLLPIPLFTLMGEVMLHSRLGFRMTGAIDKLMGAVPGRLSLVAVIAGTVFAAMVGSSMASVAMLGSVLMPEMEKQGYKKSMSIGPIIGSGGLAIMIPPTTLGIVLCAIAGISVGSFLIAIVVPGLLLALSFTLYIPIRCWLDPTQAPSYRVPPTPLSTKVLFMVRDVLPLGLIVFLVLGLIFVGVATPSESAALGAVGCFVLAAAFGQLNWQVIKKSLTETTKITVMILMILASATMFSQLLAYTGGVKVMAEFFQGLSVPPIVTVILMQIVVIIMGMFMNSASILMIVVPIFFPTIIALGFDPIWFGALILLNIEIGCTTPPYGTNLFVMKGVAPRGTTMDDIIKACFPYLALNGLVMALMIAFPQLTLWLPSKIM